MLDPRAACDPLEHIEALVRSAQDYVQVSRDLRPRVLETARAQRAEHRAMRRIWQVAVFVVFAGLFTMSERQRPERIDTSHARAAADAGYFSSPTGASGDSAWGMVESFTEMRRRQAELLRLAL
jgi:hypothetical protein